MDALNAYLASLGPWGIAIGIGLTLLGQYVRNRMLPNAPPSDPTPPPVKPPAPVPLPMPAPSNTPILDALLSLIRSRLIQVNSLGSTSDIDHATAAEMVTKLLPPKQ